MGLGGVRVNVRVKKDDCFAQVALIYSGVA